MARSARASALMVVPKPRYMASTGMSTATTPAIPNTITSAFPSRCGMCRRAWAVSARTCDACRMASALAKGRRNRHSDESQRGWRGGHECKCRGTGQTGGGDHRRYHDCPGPEHDAELPFAHRRQRPCHEQTKGRRWKIQQQSFGIGEPEDAKVRVSARLQHGKFPCTFLQRLAKRVASEERKGE